MRGRYAITKTKWWLERGPILIPDVAAINLEYNKPSVDEYGLSKGAHIYNTFYIPQLRYKNPNVQVDVRTNMTAVPFMQIYFKGAKSENWTKKEYFFEFRWQVNNCQLCSLSRRNRITHTRDVLPYKGSRRKSRFQ